MVDRGQEDTVVGWDGILGSASMGMIMIMEIFLLVCFGVHEMMMGRMDAFEMEHEVGTA